MWISILLRMWSKMDEFSYMWVTNGRALCPWQMDFLLFLMWWMWHLPANGLLLWMHVFWWLVDLWDKTHKGVFQISHHPFNFNCWNTIVDCLFNTSLCCQYFYGNYYWFICTSMWAHLRLIRQLYMDNVGNRIFTYNNRNIHHKGYQIISNWRWRFREHQGINLFAMLSRNLNRRALMNIISIFLKILIFWPNFTFSLKISLKLISILYKISSKF